MRPALRIVSVLAGVLTMAAVGAGCAKDGPHRAGNPPARDPAVPADVQREFDTRAAEVAEAWKTSGIAENWHHGFVPLSTLTLLPDGDGTDATKLALAQGWFQLRAPLLLPPPPGTVTFADGTTMKVPLQTVEDAYRQIATEPPAGCGATPAPVVPTPLPTTPDAVPPDSAGPSDGGGSSGSTGTVPCKLLTITNLTLGTDHLLTSRGVATVPVWQFHVPGLDKPVERVAVDPSAITPPPGIDSPGADLPGIVGGQSIQSVDGTALTFRVVLGHCDVDVHALVYEDADVVVVGATKTTPKHICDDMAVIQPLDVTLGSPLGARVVLDVSTGNPLSVTNLP
ncbi:MAG TPA: hypothetical protein VKB69_08025 [Micromonosporaceae bacterium]|nr:hypothetical protein [Micromonosporaceae bacterium]